MMDDRRARFEAQVLPHLDAAYRYARWLSAAPGDADDVVQDAILRAFRGFDALRGTDVKAWLLAIVRNCHLSAQRQTQRRGYVPLPQEHDAEDAYALVASAPGPEALTIRRDQERALGRVLAEMAEEQREVLVLREIEDLDYRQIAAVTRVPIGTVMSRLARARAQLRTRWLTTVEALP